MMQINPILSEINLDDIKAKPKDFDRSETPLQMKRPLIAHLMRRSHEQER